jgi:hypothetical protein
MIVTACEAGGLPFTAATQRSDVVDEMVLPKSERVRRRVAAELPADGSAGVCRDGASAPVIDRR